MRKSNCHDLKFAPDPYLNTEGQRIIFVDFESANYRLYFEIGRRSVLVETKIKFSCLHKGFPVFDLDTDEAVRVRLDGRLRPVADEYAPGTTAPFKKVCWQVEPGEHTLEVEHHLEKVNAVPGPLEWSNGGVHCVFHMVDIIYDGWRQRFMGSYLPSNLEYDHYAMTFDVFVEGASHEHVLINNSGFVTRHGEADHFGHEQRWDFSLPDTFTTSFPWFDLFPRFLLEYETGQCERRDGKRKIEILAYGIKGSRIPQTLPEFVAAAKKHLGELEDRYGRFPYDQLTIRQMPEEYGGMEHAGATPTSLESLRHELDHCYFARSVAPADGDSGWIDEAVAAWGDNGFPRERRKPEAPENGLLTDSQYSRFTRDTAYTDGASFLAYLDYRLRKKGGMSSFLRHYHKTCKFKSVDVATFKKLLEEFLGDSLDEEFSTYVGYPPKERRDHVVVDTTERVYASLHGPHPSMTPRARREALFGAWKTTAH